MSKQMLTAMAANCEQQLGYEKQSIREEVTGYGSREEMGGDWIEELLLQMEGKGKA